MAGKGCKPRPFSIKREEFRNNWDEAFNKEKNKQQKNDAERKNYQKQPSVDD